MRVSRLMLVTLRDDPAEAEIASHRLLLRGCFIRRLGPGLYAYLPLLWRVLQKISAIVRQEMNRTGALETLLPQLQPAELWQRSGRWAGYTAGEGIMFHLQDRQGRLLGLGPTHEEVVTAVAAELVRSYRQLPVNLYQIQTKFRDEIRPRFGLMRGREFIMKDAYSFHVDQACLRRTYAEMDAAYRRIFQRCGLQTVAVEADSGAIGGSASQEFMVTADSGEDLILTSADGRYAANQERAVSLPPVAVPLPSGAAAMLHTPGQATIEVLAAAHGLNGTQIVKVLLLLARFAEGVVQPLLVCLRGDQQLNEVKLANTVSGLALPDAGGLLEIAPLEAGVLQRWQAALDPSQPAPPLAFEAIPLGYLGPDLSDTLLAGEDPPASAAPVAGASPRTLALRRRFLRLVDATAAELERFVCGANQPDQHRFGSDWLTLFADPSERPAGLDPGSRLDLRAAQPGDRCLHDPGQTLSARRGIEVGHIFQLGCKYSQALEARFTAEDGRDEPIWMGCYGIGVSRLAQAAVEQNHDAAGIRWPLAIAPFEVIVVSASAQDPAQVSLAETLHERLLAAGIDGLLDDRDERAGVKFKDADLIGIPWRLVVGRGVARGEVELVCRADGRRLELPVEEAIALLLREIPVARAGLLPSGDAIT